MKNIRLQILLFTFLLFTVTISLAQSYEIRTEVNDIGYIEVQMRETTGGSNLPSNTNNDLIGDIAYAIRWNSSLNTDLAFLCSSNSYNMRDPSGVVHTDVTGWDYRYYTANNTPFTVPEDWVINEWVTIATYKVTTGSGTNGSFEIAPQNFGISTLNWSIKEGGTSNYIQYEPTPNGSVSGYSYPTLVYNYVWKGGTSVSSKNQRWERESNWENECGESAADGYPYYPDVTDANVYIPAGLTTYPETAGGDNDGWYCKQLLIAENAHVTVPDLSGNTPTKLWVTDSLIVRGKLYLPALGYATIDGGTSIEASEAIEVQADATGVGSFIDNGTIGGTGTAKVQTYVSNGASSGDLYVHLLGPTLDEENYTGSGTGADLAAFNVAPGNTYAYSWNGTGWVNQYSNTYHVATTDGIALSTNDASSYTMDMVGELMTGSITSLTLPHTGSNYALMSNPYPSSIDFDAFAVGGSNASTINNKYWIWDASGSGNYIARSGGSGGTQYVQVGQAFFVETVASGTVTFTNGYRSHSNDPFRETNPNELKMYVSGGDHGFKDELYVRFIEDATYGYDPEIEAYKWNSMYEDATMIRSIADDGSELAINFLPLDGLQGDMVSVPVHFNCGYTAEYTFDFEGIDSFEAQNEVWLEDKQDNDQWIILNSNPHYTFTANPDDSADRFIIHFFGPTGVDENEADQVDIYSWGQYAYIKNVTNEKIKKVSVYDISGHLVTEKRIPEGQKLSKIWVADNMAYYIVQVITEKNVYTNKVLINK